MAEGNGLIYNNFKEQVMEGVFNLSSGGHTIQVILVNGHAVDIDTHTVYTDVSGDEYGAGAGYAVRGETLTGQDVTQDNALDLGKFDGTNVTFTALGPLSPTTPSHAIMFNESAASDELIAAWEVTTDPNGGDFILAWHADGIITLT